MSEKQCVEIDIEVRKPLVIAINPDGSETVICTYEWLVRAALGEYGGGDGV